MNPKTEKLRVVIAGAGMVTRYHIGAWKKLPYVEIAAICAQHLDNARKRAAEFKLPASYDNAIGHFVQALEQKTPFETDGLDNLQNLKLVDDAYCLAGLPTEFEQE